MLIGFLLCVAAGYFLQPYVVKIRWPKFEPEPDYLAMAWQPQINQSIAYGGYMRSAMSSGILNADDMLGLSPLVRMVTQMNEAPPLDAPPRGRENGAEQWGLGI